MGTMCPHVPYSATRGPVADASDGNFQMYAGTAKPGVVSSW